MTIALYERIWMWGATALIVLFLGAIFVTALVQAVEPPGHLETVDPTTIPTHPEFGTPRSPRGPTAASSFPWSRACSRSCRIRSRCRPTCA